MSASARAGSPAHAPSSPLHNRGFRALMLYRICTMLSYQIVAVTVGWHVYEITRSPFSLGLIGLAFAIAGLRAPRLRRLDLRELQ